MLWDFLKTWCCLEVRFLFDKTRENSSGKEVVLAQKVRVRERRVQSLPSKSWAQFSRWRCLRLCPHSGRVAEVNAPMRWQYYNSGSLPRRPERNSESSTFFVVWLFLGCYSDAIFGRGQIARWVFRDAAVRWSPVERELHSRVFRNRNCRIA